MERIGNLLVGAAVSAILLAAPALVKEAGAQDTAVQVTRGAEGVSETREAGVLVARGQPAPRVAAVQAAPAEAFQPVGGERFWLYNGTTGALIGCRFQYSYYAGDDGYIDCERRRLDIGLPLRPFSLPAY